MRLLSAGESLIARDYVSCVLVIMAGSRRVSYQALVGTLHAEDGIYICVAKMGIATLSEDDEHL